MANFLHVYISMALPAFVCNRCRGKKSKQVYSVVSPMLFIEIYSHVSGLCLEFPLLLFSKRVSTFPPPHNLLQVSTNIQNFQVTCHVIHFFQAIPSAFEGYAFHWQKEKGGGQFSVSLPLLWQHPTLSTHYSQGIQHTTKGMVDQSPLL